MPQATIKLQVAPKPAAMAARKLEEGAITSTDAALRKLETSGEKEASMVVPKAAGATLDDENESAEPEVPLPVVMAAAALALVALAIQVWTFIS